METGHFYYGVPKAREESRLLMQGIHPKVVSERLGHSTVGITLDFYSHVLPGLQEDAAKKLDLSLRSAIKKQESDSRISRGLGKLTI